MNTRGILFGQLGSNVTVQDNTFLNITFGLMTYYGDMYPTESIGFNNFLISGNTFNDRLRGVLQPILRTAAAISQPGIRRQHRNHVGGRAGGLSLLCGGFDSPTPIHGRDLRSRETSSGRTSMMLSSFQGGNNFPIWADTIRTNLSSSGMNFYYYGGTSGPVGLCPDSPLTVLGGNLTTGSLYVNIDPADPIPPSVQNFPTTLAAYPLGFTVTFISPYQQNWVLAADPAWNTLTSNVPVPVGTVGVTLQMNANGLFSLIPTLAGIEGSSLAYTADAPATALTSALTISDADSSTMAGRHDPDRRELPKRRGPARLRQHRQHRRRLERNDGDLDPQRRR